MMRSKKYGFILGLCLIVSLGLRLYFGVILPNHLTPDSDYYHQLAINIEAGRGLVLAENGSYRAVYEHTPGYPLFLALIYQGLSQPKELQNSDLSVLTVIVIQQGLTVWLAFIWGYIFYLWTKRRILSWFFTALSLLYVPYMVAANYLLSEAWGLWVMSLVVLALSYAMDRKHLKLNILAGLMWGLGILIRPAMTVLWPAYGLWLWIFAKFNRNIKIKLFGYLCLGLLMPLIIWIIRTGLTTRHWVPVQVGVSRVLISGGCPGALCGIDYGKMRLPVEEVYLPKEKVSTEFNFIWLWWWYGVKKVRDFLAYPFGFHELRAAVNLSSWYAKSLYLSHLLFLGFMILGGIKTLRQKTSTSLALVWLETGILAHALLWSEPRYALMYMPLVMVLAVEGIDYFWGQRKVWWKWLSARAEKVLLFTGLLLFFGLILYLPEIAGWGFLRVLASFSFWFGILIVIVVGVFYKTSYTLRQKVVAGLYVLLMWGLLIGLWQPTRSVFSQGFPNNDYLFPVVIWANQQMWW